MTISTSLFSVHSFLVIIIIFTKPTVILLNTLLIFMGKYRKIVCCLLTRVLILFGIVTNSLSISNHDFAYIQARTINFQQLVSAYCQDLSGLNINISDSCYESLGREVRQFLEVLNTQDDSISGEYIFCLSLRYIGGGQTRLTFVYNCFYTLSTTYVVSSYSF